MSRGEDSDRWIWRIGVGGHAMRDRSGRARDVRGKSRAEQRRSHAYHDIARASITNIRR